MRIPGLPDEVTKALRWNLSVDTLDGVVAYSFDKAAWSRADAWDQIPVLPDNPWRKCHTKHHWVWYRFVDRPGSIETDPCCCGLQNRHCAWPHCSAGF